MTIEEFSKIPIPPLYECGEILVDKFWRLKSYFHMLEIAEPTNSALESLELINNKMVEVEDCHSGVLAEDNPGLKYKGRMYPVLDDNIEYLVDGGIRAFSKNNKIIIEPDGAFTIYTKMYEQILTKKNNGKQSVSTSGKSGKF